MINLLLERFTKDAPVATMVRAMLVNVLADHKLDEIFRETAVRQRESSLLFSTVVNLLHLAVLKNKRSVNNAYQSCKEEIGVSIAAVYEKLAGTEMQVIRQLVRETARQMAEIDDALRAPQQQVLPGYEVRILDGAHLRATERRLDVQRMFNGAPLPGQALVILDPQRRLVEDMLPVECGHRQERAILHDLVEDLRPGIVWIADRNFCTSVWLQEINLNRSWFIIRQHGQFPYEAATPLRHVGKTETGEVWEQEIVHRDRLDVELVMRRVVIQLFEPTSDGDMEIALLTNLPQTVTGLAVADAYRHRWGIEGLFGELTLGLNGEISTLAYPPAALLAYALALISYNVLSLVKASVEVVHGADVAEELSVYYMAEEVATTYHGMCIAITPTEFAKRFSKLTPADLAEELKQMAAHIELRRYRRKRRGPKNKPPDRHGSYQHVSTQKLLNQRK